MIGLSLHKEKVTQGSSDHENPTFWIEKKKKKSRFFSKLDNKKNKEKWEEQSEIKANPGFIFH